MLNASAVFGVARLIEKIIGRTGGLSIPESPLSNH
jgi:hypothetical protein